jgi:hypothetical protein
MKIEREERNMDTKKFKSKLSPGKIAATLGGIGIVGLVTRKVMKRKKGQKN